jgi:hypothetical protein
MLTTYPCEFKRPTAIAGKLLRPQSVCAHFQASLTHIQGTRGLEHLAGCMMANGSANVCKRLQTLQTLQRFKRCTAGSR